MNICIVFLFCIIIIIIFHFLFELFRFEAKYSLYKKKRENNILMISFEIKYTKQV